MSKKGISVVIPNYNGWELLQQTLPTVIEALNNSGLAFEVIVSDDASKDESLSFLKEFYPAVICIKNAANQGFSPTINKGIMLARYDMVMLLNSDVKLTPGYFAPLLPYFDQADTFGVMGRIVGWEDDHIQDAAKYPVLQGAKIKTSGNYYLLDNKGGDWVYSMYLSGANALVSREKLISVGGFDEIFAPFYVEDFELSLRAWRLSWKCYYEHDAICRHQVSTSIKSKERKSFINTIYYRNKMFLHAMHLEGLPKLLWYLQLIPEIIIHLFTGRLYYFKSLQLFFAGHQAMKFSEKKLAGLANDSGKALIPVRDVVRLIQQSVSAKAIKRF